MSQVREAWEHFVDGGELRGAAVRSIVAKSWERSAQLSISVGRRKAPLLSEGELYRRRGLNAAMITAAAPALTRSRTLLAEARSMLILADASGTIVGTEGDPRIIDLGRENHLELGGQWEEGQIGTNAIGTALAESIPLQIHGSEHYCETVQRWTCAAAPVVHPGSRRLVGVVDISGAVDAFNPQSMALAVAIGGEIEAALDRTLRMQHEDLLRHFFTKRSVWLTEDMVVVDRYGQVVCTTDDGDRQVALLNEPGSMQDCWEGPVGEWREKLRKRHPHAEMEAVRRNGEDVGAIIFTRGYGRPLPRPAIRKPVVPDPRTGFGDILGESAALRAVKERARCLAEAKLAVLVEGETGTGKELFARAIHQQARGNDAPFVPVNCGGIAQALIASELFGYSRGSFTGADEKGRNGRIAAADGGTLCLDEIGEMPLELQPYLLRVLEDGIVFPVGSQAGRRVDLVLVSMTNRSLASAVESGRFRGDLYYRIAAATLTIPPLRERGEDAALLARHFAAQTAARMNRSPPVFTNEALDALCACRWPGNIRQLRNLIDTILALSKSAEIDLEHLPGEILAGAGQNRADPGHALRQAEESAIRQEIERCDGNMTKAARSLGIARSTLYLRLGAYGIARSA